MLKHVWRRVDPIVNPTVDSGSDICRRRSETVRKLLLLKLPIELDSEEALDDLEFFYF